MRPANPHYWLHRLWTCDRLGWCLGARTCIKLLPDTHLSHIIVELAVGDKRLTSCVRTLRVVQVGCGCTNLPAVLSTSLQRDHRRSVQIREKGILFCLRLPRRFLRIHVSIAPAIQMVTSSLWTDLNLRTTEFCICDKIRIHLLLISSSVLQCPQAKLSSSWLCC